MLIVSRIERKGGSKISVDGAEYFFEPHDKTGKHICEVKNPAHVKRLLSIPEGFEAFDPDEAAEMLGETPEQALESAVEPEPDAAPDPDEGAEAAEADPEADLEEAIEPEDDGLDDLDDLSLGHAYKDVFNAVPDKKMKRSTIIKRIRTAEAEAAAGK